ncbi:hypothetical protein N8H10_17765 [Curtobacterium flaccumfaciens pv. poinsettiae]|nr:hypothetical protein [Curtobacterium flaccumfaciens pv. poinsettiae]
MDWKARIKLLIDGGATVDSIAAHMGVTPNAGAKFWLGELSAR